MIRHMALFMVLFLFFIHCTDKTPQEASTENKSVSDEIVLKASTENAPDGKLQLDKIKLPAGFKISVWAKDLENARSMTLSEDGTLYVGTRRDGRVYALKDTDGDYTSDQRWTIMKGGNMPNGVAMKDGDLYVAEVNRILRFNDIENNLADPGKPDIVYDQYPTKTHHGWKYIAFGPDGLLYVPVGAPCNVCESADPVFNTITSLNVNTGERKIVQKGIRNSVGFTWHPITKDLWFTDNGRDWLGDDLPACELNHAPSEGLHFGFPYCHQGDLLDPKFGKGKDCDDYIPPVQNLLPHIAPLGLEFYQGTQFPEEYQHQILIAEHGSWNRTTPQGYRVSLVRLEGNKAISYQAFAEGWLQEGNSWGRPVDIEHLPDGSILVSDDYGDAIYRIWYEG